MFACSDSAVSSVSFMICSGVVRKLVAFRSLAGGAASFSRLRIQLESAALMPLLGIDIRNIQAVGT